MMGVQQMGFLICLVLVIEIRLIYGFRLCPSLYPSKHVFSRRRRGIVCEAEAKPKRHLNRKTRTTPGKKFSQFNCADLVRAKGSSNCQQIYLSRKSALNSLSAGLATVLLPLGSSPQSAYGFPNKISDKYDDRPKRRGPKPKDLGLATRVDMAGDEYVGLKPCGAAPNCFCSTDNADDDPTHVIPPWIWPESLNKREAFEQLGDVVNSYKPGQSNVDGGGFQIVKLDKDSGYLYAQFEALKNGYIDDLEVAHLEGKDDRAAQVRSSSRVGYLDFGVNAKRLNFIANALRAKGWDAEGVNLSTHQDYAIQNNIS